MLALSIAFVAAFFALVLGVAHEVGAQADLVDVPIWSAMCTAVVAPLIWRVARGGIDPFEPLVLATFAFVVLFLGRTAFDIATDNRTFAGGVDISATYAEALAVTLLAIVGFQIGYALPSPRELARRLPPLPDGTSDALLIGGGLVVTAVAAAALTARALLAGGFDTLFLNRAEGSLELGGVPFISESIVIAVPAFLLLWSVSSRARVLGVLLSAVPIGIVLVASAPSGDRRYLLQAIFAAGIYLFIRVERRPSFRVVALAGLAALFLVVTPLRAARLGEMGYFEGVAAGITDPLGSVQDLFQSGDTEMVNTLAFLIQNVGGGRDIDWQYGMSFLTETVLQPIPRQIWTDKPQPIRNQIIEANWGMANGRCISICPTFSILGSFYADLGPLTVMFGSFALGFLLRTWFEYFHLNQRSILMRVAYIPTVFLAFYAWWSSLSVLVLGVGLFVFPVLILAIVARLQSRPAQVALPLPA